MKNSNVKNAIFTAVCVALCVVLPMAFHAIPEGGRLFSPMHMPVFLCGLAAGPIFGLLSGVLGPVMSSLITGMPPSPVLPGMILELAVYGLVIGLVFQKLRTKKTYTDALVSLIIAMLAGRVVAGLANALIFRAGEYSFAAWTASYFVKAWPALLTHIVIIPLVYLALEKAGLLEPRYATR